MKTTRIFVAFDISADARVTAADHMDRLRRDFADCPASWTNAEKLHFTLRFLGDVAGAHIEAVCRTAEEVAAESSMFELSLAGTGVFPSPGKARVLWIGTKGDIDRVALTKSRLDERLVGLGFERESKRFTPHLTLARLKNPAACRPLVSRHLASTIESPLFTVGEIVVYESKLHPSGSAYTALTRGRLRGKDNTKK